MKGTLEEKVFYGNNITMIKRDEDCTVYKMKDVTGEGTMTCFKVFPKNQVETVKAVMRYITENIDKHITLNELSSRFDIPLTSLKLCFKGVYGTSIYAYMRSYRMQAAASMLRETNENIITVAGRVGYNNPSKFPAAFKEIMGMPPAKYQKYSV